MEPSGGNLHRHLAGEKKKVVVFLDWLSKPSNKLKDPAHLRKARLLSYFLLSLIVIFFSINIAYDLSIPGYRLPMADKIGYVVLLGAYILSRTRLTGLAAIIMLLMFPANVFTNILAGTTTNIVTTLSFLLPGFILASIFLPEFGVAIYGLLINTAIVLLPVLAPKTVDGFSVIVGALASSVLTVVLLVISMIHRDQVERDRQAELKDTYDKALEAWSRALEIRDEETEGHSLRVTELTLRLARACGLKGVKLEQIYRGALLHDIGKMAIPDAILLKPGQLSEAEWDIMRTHPRVAIDMLASIPFLQPALDIPSSHHEHWDGSGYPSGLNGEQIPLSARIFAVVDVWDALLSNRPYRPAWPREQVIRYLKEQSGRLFDPVIVERFFALQNKLRGGKH